MDNKLLQDTLGVLVARLPQGWQASVNGVPRERASSESAGLRVRGPDGAAARLRVYVKRALEPRGVLELRAREEAEERSTPSPSVVVAPYLSPAVRQRLEEEGLGFIDLTGNVRLTIERPGLFIDARGADVNPDRKARASRSLRGGKAGRVVRVLIDRKEPPGVRELAQIAHVDAGYVSRILAVLDRQALIERGPRGQIVRVDWPRLLERWAEEAPLSTRGARTTCLDPRGLTALAARLAKSELRYAVTGTLAVSELAPVAAARLAVLYVGSIDEAVVRLELRVAERGANVMLIEPEDEGVFEGSVMRSGLRAVAVSQAARDLLTSPGRGPAEAEALITWMRENEEAWRG